MQKTILIVYFIKPKLESISTLRVKESPTLVKNSAITYIYFHTREGLGVNASGGAQTYLSFWG